MKKNTLLCVASAIGGAVIGIVVPKIVNALHKTNVESEVEATPDTEEKEEA